METYQVNMDSHHILRQITCFALDMDGTIYLGNRWIDGAVDFLNAIEDTGRKYVFVTNNSSKSSAVYLTKFQSIGLSVSKDQIITSGQATIYYLKKCHAGQSVFLLGNIMLTEEFLDAGITLDSNKPDMVVSAFDTSLDYQKLCKACDFVRAGLPYVATHPDFNCPTETGFVPDIGSIHAFIEASTGRRPDRIIGKPNPEIIDYMMNKTGSNPHKTAIIGDRLYTDVAAGVNNGLTGILVLSGEAGLKDVEHSHVKPDLIFSSVKEIIPYLY